jgi:hypothetical protein
MACHVDNVPGFGRIIWCGPGPKKRRCAFCDCADAKALCDWEMVKPVLPAEGGQRND